MKNPIGVICIAIILALASFQLGQAITKEQICMQPDVVCEKTIIQPKFGP